MRPGDVLRRLGRGARRLRVLGVAALLLVVSVAGVAVWRLTTRPAVDLGTGGDVVRVGVPHGSPIPAYLDASRAELATLPPGDGYALVALAAYLPPDRLDPVLTGVTLSAVYARVPIPGQQTQIVRIPATRLPQDVTTGMDEVARRKEREATQYADDPVGRSLRELADAEATGFREHCPCVYAAVVRGDPAALARLAEREAVRVVDPAPEVTRPDRAVWLPPLPEQSGLAGPPIGASWTAGPR